MIVFFGTILPLRKKSKFWRRKKKRENEEDLEWLQCIHCWYSMCWCLLACLHAPFLYSSLEFVCVRAWVQSFSSSIMRFLFFNFLPTFCLQLFTLTNIVFSGAHVFFRSIVCFTQLKLWPSKNVSMKGISNNNKNNKKYRT